MTYDIRFARSVTGRTPTQVPEAACAEVAPDIEPAPDQLTPDQQVAWERVVKRVSDEIGPVRCGDLTFRRDVTSRTVRVDYRGSSAVLSIPHRYPGHRAWPVIVEAYAITAIVEQETGLTGYDTAAGQPAAYGDVALAAAKLGGTSRWAQEHLAGGLGWWKIHSLETRAADGHRVCAACGTVIRRYRYRFYPAGSAMYERCIGLGWCSACRVYGTTMVRVPGDKILADALTELPDERREQLRRSELRLVQYLARHELGETLDEAAG
ncbi:MAG: hypothetical protein FWE35_18290 [Streptosporangiales bacterium]|nr:hypothetical protein [Streptosporangiales bacterium]